MIDGSVNAATTPIMPRVIKTSAKVNATRLAARRLGSQAAKFLDVGRICQSDNETDLDAKMPRGIDAWAVSVKEF